MILSGKVRKSNFTHLPIFYEFGGSLLLVV